MNQPTFEEYSQKVQSLPLTIEQQIILIQTYKRALEGFPVHVNYLMSITGLNWKQINWTLNGLVLRGALEKLEDKFYITKIK
jgi:uncharacterized membrane protein